MKLHCLVLPVFILNLFRNRKRWKAIYWNLTHFNNFITYYVLYIVFCWVLGIQRWSMPPRNLIKKNMGAMHLTFYHLYSMLPSEFHRSFYLLHDRTSRAEGNCNRWGGHRKERTDIRELSNTWKLGNWQPCKELREVWRAGIPQALLYSVKFPFQGIKEDQNRT